MPRTSSPAHRRVLPPRFAVQRTGGGKAKIVAVHERHYPYFEAVTVTTVDSLAIAKQVAHLLNLAWRDGNSFDPKDRRYFGDLFPGPVVKALVEAQAGCPQGEEQILKSEDAWWTGAARAAVNFDDSDILTPHQAWQLSGHLDLLNDMLGDAIDDGHTEYYPVSADIVGEQDKRWWRSVALAFKDLSFDIESGRAPEPTSFGEVVALWKAVGEMPSYMEMQRHGQIEVPHLVPLEDQGDDDLDEAWGLVWNDLLSAVVSEIVDADVQMDAVDLMSDFAAFCALRPASQWHHTLPGRIPRDPARLLI